MDFVTLGESMLRLSTPLGESLEFSPAYNVDIGGTESNVASALARLGLKTGWISRLPDNVLGRRVEKQVHWHGVDTSRVIWASGNERMGTYFIDLGRPPRPSAVVYERADSAASRMLPDEVDWEYLGQASWLHLTGITVAIGANAHQTVERAIYEANRRGQIISFDVNHRAKLWSAQQAAAALEPLLKQVTIVQCGARDAALIFGTPPDGGEAARALYDRFHPKLVVVTEGETGGIAFDGQEHRGVPVHADTVDPIGSGDAFAAGFIAGYREGGIDQGLAWGNTLAAIKRTYRGDMVWCGRPELEAARGRRSPRIALTHMG